MEKAEPTTKLTSSPHDNLTVDEVVEQWLRSKYPQQVEQLKHIILPWVRKRYYQESWKKIEAKLSMYCKEIQFNLEQEKVATKQQQEANASSDTQLSQFVEQQTNFIWQELKEEILQIVAQLFQNNETWFTILLGLFDYQTVIDAVVSFLQMKERQWRQYPREWIERKFDEWMEPLETNGRDFFRFIISELRRLQSHLNRINQGLSSSSIATLQSELRNRAIRVLAYILSEIIERNIMPIPQFVFLDDKMDEATSRKEKQGQKPLAKTKEEEGLPSHEKQNNVNPTQQVLSFVERLLEKKLEATTKTNQFDLKEFITTEQIDERKQRDYYSRYRMESTGNVGPLKIKLPLYRNPDERIRELELQKKQLLQKQEKLQQMKEIFASLNPREQTLIKLLIKKKQQQLEVKKKHEQVLFNLSDETHLQEEGKKIVPNKYLKAYYQKVLEKVGREKMIQMQQEQYKLLLQRQEARKDQYPEVFLKLRSISLLQAEELLKDIEDPEKQQLIISSNYLITVLRTQVEFIVKQKIDKNSSISFERFVEILDTNENLKQGKFMETIFKVCNILQGMKAQKVNKGEQETHYSLLYKAVVEHIPLFTPEITSNHTRDVLNEVTAYIAQGGSKKACNRRLDLLEEFCLDYLMTPEYHSSSDGEQDEKLAIMEFCLQFTRSLRDTIEVEIQQPNWQPNIPTPTEFEETQKLEVIKRGAYQFVDSALPNKEEKELLETLTKKASKKQLEQKKQQYINQMQQLFREKKRRKKKPVFQSEEQEYFYYQQKIQKLKWDLYGETQHYHLG